MGSRFEKLRLALAAIATAGVVFAGLLTLLTGTATWAERDLEAFPFKSEDWLRYLLPSRFENSAERDMLMLAGASTVRENLYYDVFEAAFPSYDVYQGGISSGTLVDVTAGLEYLEQVHGKDALPEVIVLGISLRMVANLPVDRAFAPNISRYSPYFDIEEDPVRLSLVPKGRVAGLSARIRFLAKQPERFRVALLGVLHHVLSSSDSPVVETLNGALRHPVSIRILSALWSPEVARTDHVDLLAFWISPYKYSLLPHLSDEVYDFLLDENYDPAADYTWSGIYDWDPAGTDADNRARIRHFIEFVATRNIPTLVINLPERDRSRARYDSQHYAEYLELVEEEFEELEFVNLHEFLDAGDFYDREHTMVSGSNRLSGEVVRLLKETILADPSAVR